MSDPINGGPAFPLHPNASGQIDTGLSLRDYFATHANESDLYHVLPTHCDRDEWDKKHPNTNPRTWARYKHADAMLEARKQ